MMKACLFELLWICETTNYYICLKLLTYVEIELRYVILLLKVMLACHISKDLV